MKRAIDRYTYFLKETGPHGSLISLSYLLLVFALIVTFNCAPYSLPEKHSYSDEDNPYTFYAGSMEAYEQRDYQLALSRINRALELNPNLAHFYQLKGDILRQMDQKEEALRFYTIAVDKRSNFVDAHLSIGEIYQEQEQYHEAIKAFKRAEGLEPNRVEITLRIVKCYILLNELPVASHYLDTYEKNARNLDVQYSDRYYLLRGEVNYLLKQYNESLKYLNQIKSDLPEGLQLTGKNYYALGDYETGVTFFNRLMNLQKENGRWYYYRGIYFFQKEDYKDAKAQFLLALQLSDLLIEPHYYLGKIYMQEKNTSEAMNQFKIYRQRMRDSDKIEEVEELLKYIHIQE
jgi:tetratricopeptide (TPR) repeat protein